jgi:putative hydrolase of the HAD superfamily
VVLFDLYDTLARIDVNRVIEARHRLGVECGIDVERFQALWQENSQERMLGKLGCLEDEIACMLQALGGESTPTLVTTLAHGDRSAWIEGVRLYRESLPTLRLLKRRGYTIGLVSNCSCLAGDVIRAQRLDRHLNAMALSYELGLAKPNQAIFLAACSQLGVEPESCIYVADGASGELNAAQQLGMLAVLIEHDDQNRRSPSTDSYDVRINSLSELKGLLG